MRQIFADKWKTTIRYHRYSLSRSFTDWDEYPLFKRTTLSDFDYQILRKEIKQTTFIRTSWNENSFVRLIVFWTTIESQDHGNHLLFCVVVDVDVPPVAPVVVDVDVPPVAPVVVAVLVVIIVVSRKKKDLFRSFIITIKIFSLK